MKTNDFYLKICEKTCLYYKRFRYLDEIAIKYDKLNFVIFFSANYKQKFATFEVFFILKYRFNKSFNRE